MRPLTRLVLRAARWKRRADLDPIAPDWIAEAVREGIRAARGLPGRSDVRLRSLALAWSYCEELCDRHPELNERLNGPLGDWADVLMRACKES